jgi:hypothetical protein
MKPMKVFFASVGSWNFLFKTDEENHSRLLETIQNHKTDSESLFITIIENGSDWDTETVCSARGYLALLTDSILIFS